MIGCTFSPNFDKNQRCDLSARNYKESELYSGVSVVQTITIDGTEEDGYMKKTENED